MSGDPKRRVAFSALALVAHLFGTHMALAASATWRESGTNGDWNNAANWNPATVPNGPADVATFRLTDQFAGAFLTADTEVSGILFDSGAPAWNIVSAGTFTLTISGMGVTNNSSALQALIASGASGVVRFQNSATAGSANVGVNANNGGAVLFTGASTGGGAQLNASPNGSIDISGLTTAGMTAGVITDDAVGANFFRLGSKTLTVGSANLDRTLTAVIADGGAAGGVGGSIVKVGTGTMTYAGSAANTYTGTTFVNEGRLVLSKHANVDAIAGPLVVGDGLGAAGTAVLWVEGVENIHNSQPVTVNGDGRFEVLSNVLENIGSLTVNKGGISVSGGVGELVVVGPLVMTGGAIGGVGTISLLDPMIQATSASDGAPATVSAALLNLGNTSPYTFTVSDGPGATDLLISGNVIDIGVTASIVKAGGGVMVLSGNNTYGGSTTITAGTLSISDDANLGRRAASPAANHLVFDGGTLRATGGSFIGVNGNRGITLNAGGGTVDVTAGSELFYGGIVAGAGGLTKTGLGTLDIGGSSANSYTGTTTVNDGTLRISKSAQSIAGPLVIGDGIGAANSARVSLGFSFDAAPVTIQRDGLLSIGAFVSEGIAGLTVGGGNVLIGANGSLSMTGTLAMTGGTISGGPVNVLNVTASSDAGGLAATIMSAVNLGGATQTFTVNDGPGTVDLDLTGEIDNGGITKTGAGSLDLAGFNDYAGPTTVIAGTLIVSGNIGASTTVVANGATLQGTGATGPLTINSGATLVPGLSAGTLTTGNLTLAAGSTSSFELAVAGVVGGGVNDLVAVNGDLVLGGTLAITTLPGFGPGAYPLFTYTNTATNQGLAFESSFLAAHPGSTIALDSVNKRVVANITAAPLLAADFDEDGDVDGADLTRWRNGFGTGATHMQGNADADGDVDGGDFLVWQRQLGGDAATAAATAVPEPGSFVLLAIALPLIGRRWRQCRSRSTARSPLANASRAVLPCVVVLVILPNSHAFGQTLWQGAVGSWFSPANWTGGVPSASTAAKINNGGTAQVAIPGAAAQSLLLGESGGQSGTLEVSGAATFGAPNVGRHGVGTLNIINGGDVSSTGGDIAISTLNFQSTSGAATVDGVGSTWTSSGLLRVGDSGTGTLDILNGGTVSNTSAAIGVQFGSAPGTGIVTVDGPGSAWINSASLSLGAEGTGVVDVLNGATLSSATGTVGWFSGGGTLTVDGAGSSWTNSGNVVVGAGNSGVGTLKIRNSGLVTVGGGVGVVTLGELASSQGTLRIGESGLPGTISVGEITGGAGTASVVFDYTDASYVFSRPLTGSIKVEHSGAGKTTLTANHSYTGATTVTGGTLEISGGGRLNNTSAVGIAPAMGQTAAMHVVGSGSKAMIAQSLDVGATGNAALNIAGGGTVTSTSGNVGALGASSVSVDGPGSRWDVANILAVGPFSGSAMASVTGGGRIATAGTIVSPAPGSSTVLIDGPGSMWSTTGQFTLSIGFLFDPGPGLVTISNGGVLSAAGGMRIGPLGTVNGDGTIMANVSNDGLVAPGTSPGALHVTGNYTQNAPAKLQIEIASASSFDALDVTGDIVLNGTLQVSLTGGYVPSGNRSFDILDWTGGLFGTFSSIQLPTLGGALTWDTSQLYTTGVLSVIGPAPMLEADFDEDGDVDGGDLTRWRNNFATGATHMQGNADADGDVDGADFLVWQRQLGGGAATAAATAVPEPASAWLAWLGVGIVLTVCRRVRSRPWGGTS